MPAGFPSQAHSTGVVASLMPLEQRGGGRPGLPCGGHVASRQASGGFPGLFASFPLRSILEPEGTSPCGPGAPPCYLPPPGYMCPHQSRVPSALQSLLGYVHISIQLQNCKHSLHLWLLSMLGPCLRVLTQ